MRVAYQADVKSARAEPLQMGQLLQALMRLRTPGEGEADIFPGRRHPLPVTALFWSSFMMSPGVRHRGVAEGVWLVKQRPAATTALRS